MRWPTVLSPKGSSGTCIPDGLSTFLHAAFTAHTLIGPVADDPSWQARTGPGFDKAQFVVDWDRQPRGRWVSSASPGSRTPIPRMACHGRRALPAKIAPHVSTGRHVRGRRRSPALWDARRGSSMRRCTPPGNARRPLRSRRSRRLGQVWRAPTRRASAAVVSGKHGILGYRHSGLLLEI
jgi:hypothetical protein